MSDLDALYSTWRSAQEAADQAAVVLVRALSTTIGEARTCGDSITLVSSTWDAGVICATIRDVDLRNRVAYELRDSVKSA